MRSSVSRDSDKRLPNVYRRQQDGSIYLLLLLAVALSASSLAVTGSLWSEQLQRSRRAEQKLVGEEYARAIGSYYQGTPGGVRVYPQSFADLLLDKRYVTVRRHLRRLYKDPVSNEEWHEIRAPDGGIYGVYADSPNGDASNRRMFAYKPPSAPR